jgi:septum formation protein
MNMDPHIQLFLASSSPRRKELLTQMGVLFSVVEQDVEETWFSGEIAQDFVLRLAAEKAIAGYEILAFEQNEHCVLPVLGSDTIVVVDGQVLGKPENRKHGIAMLMSLSGKTHQVMTAVAVQSAQRLETELNISKVTFSTLTASICERYWNTGEPVDKAGGYAIQGKGAVLIKELAGSYSGVMGLPVYETARLLNKFNILVL